LSLFCHVTMFCGVARHAARRGAALHELQRPLVCLRSGGTSNTQHLDGLSHRCGTADRRSFVNLFGGGFQTRESESTRERDPRRLAADAVRLQSGEATFSLRVVSSTISGGGLGVFLSSGDAAVPGGTVIALYAGVFIPVVPSAARAAAQGEAVVDVLHMAKLWGHYGTVDVSLSDVSFEEASQYWLILKTNSGVMDGYRPRDRVCRGVLAGDGAYSVGQLINHPPRGTSPNVDWQEFLWMEDGGLSPEEEARLAANRCHQGLWYLDPVTFEAVHMPDPRGCLGYPVPGVAIVTQRAIMPGEELFMDYRLSKPHPP